MFLPTYCPISVKKEKRKEVTHKGQYQRQKFGRSLRLSLACIKSKPKEEVGMPPVSHPAVPVIMFVLFFWYNTDLTSTSQCLWFSKSAFAHSEGHVLHTVKDMCCSQSGCFSSSPCLCLIVSPVCSLC